MAEQQNEQCLAEDDDVDNPLYKPPAQKSIDEIQKLDADDESLRKYKETLLGKGKDLTKVAARPDDPRKVIVEKVVFCSEGRPEIEMDLTDVKKAEKQKIVVKEGSQYHLKIYFYVQREIVPGLRFKQKVTRQNIPVHKHNTMVGSYGPLETVYVYKTATEDVPSGLLSRGKYDLKNEFIDDDGHLYLEWKFELEIKKDWEN